MPGRYSPGMMKLKALLVSLLMALGLTGFATPAQADPVSDYISHYSTVVTVAADRAYAQQRSADCEPSASLGHLFCLYRSWDYATNQPAVWSEGYFETNPRNTCIGVQTGDDASFFNDTRFVWWLFNTFTCGGSHRTAYPHTAAQIFPTGSVHAVMRTSALG